MEHHIDILEQPRANHVDLPRPALFGRRPVVT